MNTSMRSWFILHVLVTLFFGSANHYVWIFLCMVDPCGFLLCILLPYQYTSTAFLSQKKKKKYYLGYSAACYLQGNLSSNICMLKFICNILLAVHYIFKMNPNTWLY